MKTLITGAALAVLVAATPAVAATPPASRAEARCAALTGSILSAARIDAAAVMGPGTGWSTGERIAFGKPAPVTQAFCKVTGTIEKEIRFELWLPLEGWNGKFLGAGVGGDAGVFNLSDLPRGVNRGYAAATTDTGHRADDRMWMLGDPQRLPNFTHRANHLLAVTSKAIVARFYGKGPAHSYFVGCSGGGRQGLKEMQLFPADYDGILSGAGGPETPAMTTRRMWELDQRDRHPGLMKPTDWTLVATAGVKSCDAADGVVDGVAENPLGCRFRVSSLLCKPSDAPGTCLDARQVAFAERFYAPLTDEAGHRIDAGLLPGVLVDSGRSQLAPATFGQAVRHRADWDGADFDLATDRTAIDRVMPELRADGTDLSAFTRRGGKAILYSGWMDPAVAARMMIAYRDRLVAAAGGQAQADAFLRLYMLPGVYHCARGPGPDMVGGAGADGTSLDPQHDLLSALEAWVEQGRAPGAMIAAKLDGGKVIRTRPICAYPAHAVYKGQGSTDLAASFTCSDR